MLSLRAFAKNVRRKSVRRRYEMGGKAKVIKARAKVDVILRYVSYRGNSFIYLVGLSRF